MKQAAGKRKYKGLSVTDDTHKELTGIFSTHNGEGRVFNREGLNSAKLIREVVECIVSEQEGWVSFTAIKDYLFQNFYRLDSHFGEWLQDGNHVRALKASESIEWDVYKGRYLNFRYTGDPKPKDVTNTYPKGMVEFASYLPVLAMEQGFNAGEIAHTIIGHKNIFDKAEWIGGLYVAVQMSEEDLANSQPTAYQPLIHTYIDCIKEVYRKVVGQAIQEG